MTLFSPNAPFYISTLYEGWGGLAEGWGGLARLVNNPERFE